MAKILTLRFSALGDIAMTIPVMCSFAKQYPNDEIIFVSKKILKPLEIFFPKNIKFVAINFDNYKGLIGLHKLYLELKNMNIDAVADLHDVLRTKVLRTFFYNDGIKTAHIDKEHYKRKQLTRRFSKKKQQLTTSIERYINVFKELGYNINLDFENLLNGNTDITNLKEVIGQKHEQKWIGIAPFAQHKGKIYPLSRMERVIHLLTSIHPDYKIFLFGSGKKEKIWCEKWETENERVISLVGKFTIDKELQIMANLDMIISMDSANMHLASLVNIPIISIWGATHPYAGFAGLQPKGSKIIQVDKDCCPCSIFGKKECHKRWKYKCLWDITPEIIIEAIEQQK